MIFDWDLKLSQFSMRSACPPPRFFSGSRLRDKLAMDVTLSFEEWN